LKTSTTNINQSLTVVQKDVKDLLNPLAIRYRGVTITPLGFADMGSAIRTANTNSDLTTPFGNIPLNGTPNSKFSELRMSARYSRLGIRFVGNPNDNVRLTGLVLGDFVGDADPSTNPGQTNSWLFRIREAWAMAEFKNGLSVVGGQMFSLWVPGRRGVLPGGEFLSFAYEGNEVVGMPYERGVQLRIGKKFGKNVSFAFELDEPEMSAVSSTYTPSSLLGIENSGTSFPAGNNMPVPCCSQTFLVYPSGTSQLGTGAATVVSPVAQVGSGYTSLNGGIAANVAPDLVAKIAWDSPKSPAHFEVRGITRFFRSGVALNGLGLPINTAISGQTTIINTSTMINNGTTSAQNFTSVDKNTAIAYGLGIAATVPVTQKVNFVLTADAGAGIGSRYNPAGTNNTGDATVGVDSSGTYVLKPIKSAALAGGFEINPTPKLTVYLYGGNEYYQRQVWADPYGQLNGSLQSSSYNHCGTGGTQGCLGYGPSQITSATSQTSPNRDIWEGTFGYIYRFWSGPFGTFQTMGEYSYINRSVWQTNSIGENTKGKEQVVNLAMRYILP
jgi:hypothetical protein